VGGRGIVGIVLSVLATLVSLALLTGGASAAETRTIAESTTSDFRVVVQATNQGGGGGAPAATVMVRTFERSGGAWRRTSERRLAGTYFWKTITGALAVCRLELRTTGARARFRPHAIVQLLRSPSLGCGPVSEHALRS
jgi:hypothetical protein